MFAIAQSTTKLQSTFGGDRNAMPAVAVQVTLTLVRYFITYHPSRINDLKPYFINLYLCSKLVPSLIATQLLFGPKTAIRRNCPQQQRNCSYLNETSSTTSLCKAVTECSDFKWKSYCQAIDFAQIKRHHEATRLAWRWRATALNKTELVTLTADCLYMFTPACAVGTLPNLRPVTDFLL